MIDLTKEIEDYTLKIQDITEIKEDLDENIILCSCVRKLNVVRCQFFQNWFIQSAYYQTK